MAGSIKAPYFEVPLQSFEGPVEDAGQLVDEFRRQQLWILISLRNCDSKGNQISVPPDALAAIGEARDQTAGERESSGRS